MTIHIANAPCSWGVDDPDNPFLPPWQKVLSEAAQAGYRSIESGPWRYLPTEAPALRAALEQHGLSLVAGTLFDDLVSEENFPAMVELAHSLCQNLAAVPTATPTPGDKHSAPYLVIIDFGHPERARLAGQADKAPRLAAADWQRMMQHIATLSQIAAQYGVRAVIHPHAGGCIEFADELAQLVNDIPHDVAGLCLDTGHLYYAGMDPVLALTQYWDRIDYLHFKDVDHAKWREALTREWDFFSACAQGVMCPLGTGAIDYPAVQALLTARQYQGWITIEQERDPRNAETSLRDVTASLQYLRSLGF
ncbi:AP endonuclease [Enterobacterales bacterium CwR94]|nr:AP endonuclease [Enterobacterales bacterium CwR94]